MNKFLASKNAARDEILKCQVPSTSNYMQGPGQYVMRCRRKDRKVNKNQMRHIGSPSQPANPCRAKIITMQSWPTNNS